MRILPRGPFCHPCRAKTPTLSLKLGVTLAALCCVAPLRAQTLVFSGAQPSVDFGNVNLCRAGATTPAPCSEVVPLTYNVTAGGTLGTPKVLTLGSPNLDFTLAAGTTCTGAVTAGATCVVNVKFAPRFAGGREGGVLIIDATGNVLATTFLRGSGQGPQIEFDPTNIPLRVPGNTAFPTDSVLDGAGDLFVSILDNDLGPLHGSTLYKVPADGSAPVKLNFYPENDIMALALDGAGDLIISFFGTPSMPNGVYEIPSAGGPPVRLPLPFGLRGHMFANSLTVDGMGDVFGSENSANKVFKLAPGASTPSNVTPYPPGNQTSIAADAAGNLFETDDYYGLAELPANGGQLIKYPYQFPHAFETLALDGVDNIFSQVTEASSHYTLATIYQFPVTGTPVALASGFPADTNFVYLAVDGGGNIYVTVPHSLLKLQRDRPTPVNFGTVPVNTTAAMSVRIFNGGNQTLVMTPTFSNPSYQIASTSPANCLDGTPQGQYCTLNLTFLPAVSGEQDATLHLMSNALTDPILSLAANTVGVAAPVLSVPTGVYGSAFPLSLTEGTPGAKVYYTTDGSAPSAASTPYTGPVLIESTQTFEAVAILGGVPSTLTTATYTIPALTGFQGGVVDLSHGFAVLSSAFRFNGSAALNGSRLELTTNKPTQAGSAFYENELPDYVFSTDFTFQLTNAAADGFTFTFGNVGDYQVGGSGASLGYSGIRNSVAVKFDLHSNAGEGPNSVGVYTNGVLPTLPSVDLTGSGIDLHSGHVMLAQIVANTTSLNLTLTDTASLATWSHAFPVTIPPSENYLADGWFGFTGSTGGATAVQDILNWTYVSGDPYPLPPPPSIPPLPNFPTALNAQGLFFNGSAAISGATLQLTDNQPNEAASSFFAKPVNIQGFTTDFTFLETHPFVHSYYDTVYTVQPPPADGFTFTIQNAAPTALGSNAKGLGYAGIAKSVAVKFDIHDNAGEGPDSTGLYVDGALPTVPAIDLTGSGIDLHSGNPIAAHVTYDGTTLHLTLTDTVTLKTWAHAFTIDIPTTVGGTTAYVGFTGATGGKTATQQILTWTFTNP